MKLSKKILEPGASLLYKLFRYLLLIGISYIVMFPIIKIASASFTLPEELYSQDAGYLPSQPTFINFIKYQSYFPYLEHAKNSLRISLISTAIQLVSCSLVGYGLGRYKFKGNAIVYAAVLFTIIMPIQTAMIPLVYEYRWFDFFGIGKLIGLFTGQTFTVNLLKKYMAFYVPCLFAVGFNSGIYIFLFRQFFASMPKDLEEAGKLDGCSPFAIYVRIMIPNIVPVIVTVALLSVIYYWNDSLMSGVFALKEDGKPLMVALKDMVVLTSGIGTAELDVTRRNAERYAIMLSIVTPLMLLFTFGQRFFVECMDRSGSKG